MPGFRWRMGLSLVSYEIRNGRDMPERTDRTDCCLINFESGCSMCRLSKIADGSKRLSVCMTLHIQFSFFSRVEINILQWKICSSKIKYVDVDVPQFSASSILVVPVQTRLTCYSVFEVFVCCLRLVAFFIRQVSVRLCAGHFHQSIIFCWTRNSSPLQDGVDIFSNLKSSNFSHSIGFRNILSTISTTVSLPLLVNETSSLRKSQAKLIQLHTLSVVTKGISRTPYHTFHSNATFNLTYGIDPN